MSTYVQGLYKKTTFAEKSEEDFMAQMTKKYPKSTFKNIRTTLRAFKIMLLEKKYNADFLGLRDTSESAGMTTLTNVVNEFSELKNVQTPEIYLNVISKLIQDFIDYSLSEKKCTRCYFDEDDDACLKCGGSKIVKGVSATTVRRYVTYLKKVLKYYGLLGGVSTDDFEFNLPTIEDEDPEPLTKPLIKAILEKVSGTRKLSWLFASGAGLRGAELFQILSGDCKFVDEDMQPVMEGEPYFRIKINLRSAITKGKKKRKTFAPQETQANLERLIKNTPPDQPLFRKPEIDMTNSKVYNNELFTEICEQLAIEDPKKYSILGERKASGHHKFTFHSFRSFAVTGLNRVDYGFGHALAGHSLYMGRYDRLTPEQWVEFLIKSDEYLSIFTDSKAMALKDKVIAEQRQKVKDLEEYQEAYARRVESRLAELEKQ
tara:strand:- start:64 stop:1356 length:1293 start_codon:yes stop_codon:yes gene_type:complete